MRAHAHAMSMPRFFGLLTRYTTANSRKHIINAACTFLSSQFYNRLTNNAIIASLRLPTPPLALSHSTLNIPRQDTNAVLLVPHKDFSKQPKSVRTYPISPSTIKLTLSTHPDLELIISQDSTHVLAKGALSKVTHELSQSQASPPVTSASPTTTSTPYNTPATASIPPEHPSHGVIQFPTQLPTPSPTPSSELPPPVDFAFPSPSPSTPPLYEPSLSDSSDCFHVGNGIPCRFYNTHALGCGMGLLCRFSHSPDEKSVRDNLYVSLSAIIDSHKTNYYPPSLQQVAETYAHTIYSHYANSGLRNASTRTLHNSYQ